VRVNKSENNGDFGKYTRSHMWRDIWNIPEYFYWQVHQTCLGIAYHSVLFHLSLTSLFAHHHEVYPKSSYACEITSCSVDLHISGETETAKAALYMSRDVCQDLGLFIDLVQSCISVHLWESAIT
jgi:hypothetical protein